MLRREDHITQYLEYRFDSHNVRHTRPRPHGMKSGIID